MMANTEVTVEPPSDHGGRGRYTPLATVRAARMGLGTTNPPITAITAIIPVTVVTAL
jgi:hypothetical protein